MKVCILTWGCQQNELKSEEIAGVLTPNGHALAGTPGEADAFRG